MVFLLLKVGQQFADTVNSPVICSRANGFQKKATIEVKKPAQLQAAVCADPNRF